MCIHSSGEVLKKCGHPSIGVCDEKSPELCRICDKGEVEAIFFGSEDESHARFIELEDCKHIIEANALVEWMEKRSELDSYANGSTSPKCKTIIRRTKSLNTYIQASLRDIHEVKKKTRGKPKANEEMRGSLAEKITRVLKNESFDNDQLKLQDVYTNLLKQTKSSVQGSLSYQILIEMSNKCDLIDKLRTIWVKFNERKKFQSNISIEIIKQFIDRLHMAAEFIRQYKNCEQQRDSNV